MAKLFNLARMTTATTGTGSTIALGSAIPGCLTFTQAGVANGDVISVGFKDGNNSQVGTATYSSTGPQLTGLSITTSTNSNSPINLSGAAEVFITARAEDFWPATYKAPTFTTLTSGSGTYNTPTGAVALRVRMVGGGEGSQGGGTTNPNGGVGGDTTFGTSLLIAGGATNSVGGAVTINAPAVAIDSVPGTKGSYGAYYSGSSLLFAIGGKGAASPFGDGAGANAANYPGVSPNANTGAGASGGWGSNVGNSTGGRGGNSGGYLEALIVNPSASYSYAIGAGGTAGSAGTSGQAGAASGSGKIVIEEIYG